MAGDETAATKRLRQNGGDEKGCTLLPLLYRYCTVIVPLPLSYRYGYCTAHTLSTNSRLMSSEEGKALHACSQEWFMFDNVEKNLPLGEFGTEIKQDCVIKVNSAGHIYFENFCLFGFLSMNIEIFFW